MTKPADQKSASSVTRDVPARLMPAGYGLAQLLSQFLWGSEPRSSVSKAPEPPKKKIPHSSL